VKRRLTCALLASVLAVGVAVGTGACAKDEPVTGTVTGQLTKVTYLTSFGNLGRDSFAQVAKRKGFFREAGIDVTIQYGTGTDGVIKVGTGRADFAAVDFAGGTLQVAKADLDVRAVALIHTKTLAAIMAKKSKNITTPKSLEGQVIADFPASVVKLLFPAYAQLAKVDAKKVRFQDTDPRTLISAINAPGVDGISQFVVGKQTVEAAARSDVTIVPYSNYLTDLPGNALWASGRLLREDPGLVARFRSALMKGLAYTVEHPDEAGQILHDADKTANPTLAAGEVQLMASYVGWQQHDEPEQREAALAKLGFIDGPRIARAIAILQGAGAIDAGLVPERLTMWELPPSPPPYFVTPPPTTASPGPAPGTRGPTP
jgi:NitT/TauT family transport system substrate-binding protein